jgi:hypothetical protein
MAGCGGQSAQEGRGPQGRAAGGDNEPTLTAGAASSGGEAGEGGASGAPGAGGAASEACAVTPREEYAAQINSLTLEMVGLAKPDTPVPLTISLVEVEGTSGASEAEREALFEPYQAPIEERLRERGVTAIERSSFSNYISATVPARFVSDLLCWPNVVSVDVNAPFWNIAEPPWSPEDAGPAECPIVDGRCPEHCYETRAIPYLGEPGSGCFSTEEFGQTLVACSRQGYGVDDADPVCRFQESSRRPFLFRVEPPPGAPDFLGFSECEAGDPVYCDDDTP